MNRFWEIIFSLPLRFRRYVRLSELKHSLSHELPLTAHKTVFSHLNEVKATNSKKSFKEKIKLTKSLH